MTHDSLSAAVAATLEALKPVLQPADDALAQIAVKYARELDNAGWIGRGAEKIIKMVEDDPETEVDTLLAVQALRNKLSERQTVADLGPKLLTLLDALGATPKARAAATKATGGGTGGASNKLAAFRAGRTA